MKTRLLFFSIVAMMFCSCDTPQLLEDNRYINRINRIFLIFEGCRAL